LADIRKKSENNLCLNVFGPLILRSVPIVHLFDDAVSLSVPVMGHNTLFCFYVGRCNTPFYCSRCVLRCFFDVRSIDNVVFNCGNCC